MKEYFSKLLTEQERAGSKNRSVKWGQRLKYDPDSEYEDQPSRASSARYKQEMYGRVGGHKSLTDCLNPLKGFLRKSVGRKWDDVYSELCQSLDRRSVSGLHVFTHLWQYVEKNTLMVDGKVHYYTSGYARGGYTAPIEESYRFEQFYIHPETGLLCESDRTNYRRLRYKGENSPLVIKIEEGKRYQRIDGIWYYVEYGKMDKYAGYIEHRYLMSGRSPWMTKEEIVILKKKQLNHDELKSLEVKNVPGVKDPDPTTVL